MASEQWSANRKLLLQTITELRAFTIESLMVAYRSKLEEGNSGFVGEYTKDYLDRLEESCLIEEDYGNYRVLDEDEVRRRRRI